MTYSVTTFLMSFLCLLSTLNANKSFVVGELTGQLGNQLFIIATTVSLALDHEADPIFPDLVTKSDDDTPLNFQKVFYHLNTSLPKDKCIFYYYNEPHCHYAPIPYTHNMCIRGYWQSEKYFGPHKQEILDLFAPASEITEYLKTKYEIFLSHPRTVSVHYRSYKSHDPFQLFYIQYGRDYLTQAMALFPEDTQFLIFSNDMAACKQELEGISDQLYFVENEAHYHDLYLMSMCKHNIISNSSFSWWAAYLNPNHEKIVIAPPAWFAKTSGQNDDDLIPKEWIRLPQ